MKDGNKKFKILIVHNFYQKPGGEDAVFENEKRLLEEHGHLVYTYTRHNDEIKSYNLFQKLILPFVTIFNIRTYCDIKKIIVDNDVDVIHVHNTLCLISPSVFYAAVKLKKPIVQTLHNFRMQCANGLFYRGNQICEDCITYGIMCALKSRCYRNSFIETVVVLVSMGLHRLIGIYKRVNFICLTEFNRKKLELINKKRAIVDMNKVFVKPNFAFSNISGNASINCDMSKKDNDYFVFAGRIEAIKGADIVLEAFSKMPNKELHVIGNGDDSFIQKYLNYPNIKFVGRLSNKDTISEISSSMAVISCSRCYETFGMVIIEAFSVGVPAIVRDNGNAKYLVKDGVTGFYIKDGKVDSLITLVENLSFNNSSLKNNVIAEFNSKYSEVTNYKNLMHIYDLILKKANSNCKYIRN